MLADAQEAQASPPYEGGDKGEVSDGAGDNPPVIPPSQGGTGVGPFLKARASPANSLASGKGRCGQRATGN